MMTFRYVLAVSLAFATLVLPSAARAGDPYKDPKTLEQVTLHMLWKLRQGYTEGKFVYVPETKERGLAVLLISSALKKDVDTEYLNLAAPKDKNATIVGTYKYEKKKSKWTFSVESYNEAYKGIEDELRGKQLGSQLRNYLVCHIDMSIALQDEPHAKPLRKFLDKEFNSQYYKYFEAVAKIRLEPKPEDVSALFEEFVKKDSKSELNIATELRTDGETIANGFKIGKKNKTAVLAYLDRLDSAVRKDSTETFARYLLDAQKNATVEVVVEAPKKKN